MDMRDGAHRVAKTIRMQEEAYHQARVAAVISRKSLGQWIEEAVAEKLQRETASSQPGPEHSLKAKVSPLESVEEQPS